MFKLGSSAETEKLREKCAELERQLQYYEKKLKDVVRAYKTLDQEKKALQSVVTTLNTTTGSASTEPKSTDASEVDADSDAQPSSTTEVAETEKLVALQKALARLTQQSAQQQTLYQADKKALLEENERLKARLESATIESEEQATRLDDSVKELRSKLSQIENERERELADHGAILAAIQQQYSASCAESQKLQKQLAELYQQLHSQEPSQWKKAIAAKEQEAERLQREVQDWKQKAEETPSLVLLRQQLNSQQSTHRREMEELKAAMSARLPNDDSAALSTKLAHMEHRLLESGQRLAAAETIAAHEAEKRANFEEQLRRLREDSPSSSVVSAPPTLAQLVRDANETELAEADALLSQRLVSRQSELEQLRRENASLRNQALKATTKSVSPASTSSAEDVNPRSELSKLVAHMAALQSEHAEERSRHEQALEELREQLRAMEERERIARDEIRDETESRVQELEAELVRQRERATRALLDKDDELELTRSILACERARHHQLGHSIPTDPQSSSAEAAPPRPVAGRRISKRISSESVRSVTPAHRTSSYGAGGPSASAGAAVSAAAAGLDSTRNLYYEEELAKRDRELLDARAHLQHVTEEKRSLETDYLTAKMQHIQLSDTMKGEIRELQDKLRLADSSDEVQYLRSIFSKFATCSNAASRRNILKAMGAVLKIGQKEMAALESTF